MKLTKTNKIDIVNFYFKNNGGKQIGGLKKAKVSDLDSIIQHYNIDIEQTFKDFNEYTRQQEQEYKEKLDLMEKERQEIYIKLSKERQEKEDIYNTLTTDQQKELNDLFNKENENYIKKQQKNILDRIKIITNKLNPDDYEIIISKSDIVLKYLKVNIESLYCIYKLNKPIYDNRFIYDKMMIFFNENKANT
jgi:hypothetical protein